jgi:DNA-binding CsgD family transcriptional regulator
MSKSAHLPVRDVRSILQLVGECRDLGDDSAAWQQHLFRSLVLLIEAGVATSGEMEGLLAGRAVMRDYAAWGWENAFQLDRWLQMMPTVVKEPSDFVLLKRGAERLRDETGTALTRTDLVGDKEWEPSADYAIARVMGLNHVLGGFRLLPRGKDWFSALCLWRAAGERDFSPRDRVLLRELHSAIVPLIGGPLARPSEPSPAALAPRVRQVLRCLLEGDGDKQIAARLGLTRHTVNQYAKNLFRHFGVESRAELLARWVRRGFAAGFSWEGEMNGHET